MALLDRELVHRQNLKTVKVWRPEALLERGLVEILHGVPAQAVERRDVLDGELLTKPHDTLREPPRHAGVAVEPWQPLNARATARTLNAAARNTEVGLGVEEWQVADHACDDVMYGDDPVAASITCHRPVRDGSELDPHPGTAPIAAGFIALCSCDRVPLPNAEPTDKLGVGHGGLLRLLVGFATSSVSEPACPPVGLTRQLRRSSRKSRKNQKKAQAIWGDEDDDTDPRNDK
jgi:hypothetical protein